MNNKVISSGVWFTISNFFVRGIGFITTPIFTRVLTKQEYGDYNNIFTWMTIFVIVTSLNLEASLIRARFEFENKLKDYVISMIALCTLSTLLWFFVFLIFSKTFINVFDINFKYMYCVFLYLFFYPIINLFQTMERFQYKYKWTVCVSLSVAIFTSLLSVVLVYIMPDKLYGRIIGYVIPIVIIGIIIVLYFVINNAKVHLAYWKFALSFTIPFIPHLLAMNLLSSMDRIMIKKTCGSEELAVYSLAYTCGSIITIFVSSINSAFSPWLGENMAKKRYDKIRKVSLPYVLGFSYVALVMVLMIPELLLIMGGSQYMSAKYVMPPVAASTILQFVYCMYVNIEQFEKKTNLMAVASVVAVFINYILNKVFIIRYGYIAAAYTTYVSYFVLMILHIIIVSKIGMSKVYYNLKIICVVLVASLLMFSTTIIMDMLIFRYALIITFLLVTSIIVFIKKEKIRNYIRR